MLEEARRIQLRHFGPDSHQHAVALVALFQVHLRQHSAYEAMALAPDALRLIEKHHGNHKFGQMTQTFMEGQIAKQLRDYRTAEKRYLEAL
ncbi:MAG: hypothetical protein NZO58_11550, partial [Gemmataceae bacterium]|nr:hypothetical protein [Gemmataceae bacterium]